VEAGAHERPVPGELEAALPHVDLPGVAAQHLLEVQLVLQGEERGVVEEVGERWCFRHAGQATGRHRQKRSKRRGIGHRRPPGLRYPVAAWPPWKQSDRYVDEPLRGWFLSGHRRAGISHT